MHWTRRDGSEPSSSITWTAVVAAALALPASAAAEVAPAGPAFIVNGYTTDTQIFPDVAMRSDGSFLVAWESEGSFGDDIAPRSRSIQSQLFASDGSPVGVQAQVNLSIDGQQTEPKVGALAGGGFAVVWEGDGQARLVDATGAPVGGELVVDVDDDLNYLDVDGSPDGSFTVVWSSGFTEPIEARRFDSSGGPLGPSFEVASPVGAGYAFVPRVDHAADGGFVVGWSALDIDTAATWAGRARAFASDGSPLGGEFEVVSAGYSGSTAVDTVDVAAGDSGFLIAWAGRGLSGTDTDQFGIQARTVSSAGVLGPVIDVNQVTAGPQMLPLATRTDSGYVVGWWSPESGNTRVAARELDADGTPVGDEQDFAVHADGPLYAALDGDDDSRFAVVWTAAADDADGDQEGVGARLGTTGPACTDSDGDGFAVEGGACGPVDCDDSDPAVNPAASEELFNGIDDDCDPSTPRNPSCQRIGVEGGAHTTAPWPWTVAAVAAAIALRRRRS